MSTQDRTDVTTHAPSVVQIDKSSMSLCVVAIVLGSMALGGVIVGAVMLPDVVQSRAQSSAAAANENARIAEREARIAIDQTDALRMDLAKHGIVLRTDNH